MYMKVNSGTDGEVRKCKTLIYGSFNFVLQCGKVVQRPFLQFEFFHLPRHSLWIVLDKFHVPWNLRMVPSESTRKF